MIYIFHGEDLNQSRAAFITQLESEKSANLMKADIKDLNLEKISTFLSTANLFGGKNILGLTNYFSLPKNQQDKLKKLFSQFPGSDIIIWQDKKITSTQARTFPDPVIRHYPLNRNLFACLNAIQPDNFDRFAHLEYDNLHRTILKVNPGKHSVSLQVCITDPTTASGQICNLHVPTGKYYDYLINPADDRTAKDLVDQVYNWSINRLNDHSNY